MIWSLVSARVWTLSLNADALWLRTTKRHHQTLHESVPRSNNSHSFSCFCFLFLHHRTYSTKQINTNFHFTRKLADQEQCVPPKTERFQAMCSWALSPLVWNMPDTTDMTVVGSKPEESQKASCTPIMAVPQHTSSVHTTKSRTKARIVLLHVVVMSSVEKYVWVWSSWKNLAVCYVVAECAEYS